MFGMRILWVFTMVLGKVGGHVFHGIASYFLSSLRSSSAANKLRSLMFTAPRFCDLVDLQLGVQLAARLQNLAGLVGGDGVQAAAEGDELHKVHVGVLGAVFRGGVQAAVVGPLVQDGGLELLLVPADGVFADDGSALPDDELVNTVVDLRVNVVRAARQHNDAAAFPAGLRNDLGALVAQLLHVAGVLVVGRVNGFVHGLPVQPREIMVQRLLNFL